MVNLYDNGILCQTELRALKMYTRGFKSGMNPSKLKVMWYNNNDNNTGSSGQQQGRSPNSSQLVGFHQVGADDA